MALNWADIVILTVLGISALLSLLLQIPVMRRLAHAVFLRLQQQQESKREAVCGASSRW